MDGKKKFGLKEFIGEFPTPEAWFSNNQAYTAFCSWLKSPDSKFQSGNRSFHMHCMRALTMFAGETAIKQNVPSKSSLAFALEYWKKQISIVNRQVNAESYAKKNTLTLEAKKQLLSPEDWKKIGSSVLEQLKKLSKMENYEIKFVQLL